MSYFTHSNRISNASNTTYVTAQYEVTLSDIKSKQYRFDFFKNYGEVRRLKSDLAEQSLEASDIEQLDTLTSFYYKSDDLHILDKIVLFPAGNEKYHAFLPKSPSFLFPNMVDAIRSLTNELCEQNDAKRVLYKLRVLSLEKSQNYSMLSSKNAKQQIKPLITLPFSKSSKGSPELNSIVYLMNDSNKFEIQYLDYFIKSFIKKSKYKNDLNKGFLSDYKLKQSFDDFTNSLAEQLILIFDFLEENTGIQIEIDRYLIEDISLIVYKYIDIDEDKLIKSLLNKLIYNAKPINSNVEIFKNFKSLSKNNVDGSYLKISIRAHDVDLGTNQVCVGLLSMTALFGMLHKTLESQAGLKINAFLPIFKRIELNDKATYKKSAMAKDGKQVFSTNAQLKTNLTLKPLEGKSKIFAPAFNNEVKGFIDLDIIIKLNQYIETEIIESLEDLIFESTLAGGFITDCEVKVSDEMFKINNGFAFQSVSAEDDVFKQLLKSVSFVNQTYQGDFQIGAIATGFETIASAEPVVKLNHAINEYQYFDATHAETIYKLIRFISAKNKSRLWFKPEFTNEDKPIFNLKMLNVQ